MLLLVQCYLRKTLSSLERKIQSADARSTPAGSVLGGRGRTVKRLVIQGPTVNSGLPELWESVPKTNKIWVVVVGGEKKRVRQTDRCTNVTAGVSLTLT